MTSLTSLLLLESTGPALRWLDLVGLFLVVVFLVLGAMRGLWWQLVRLLGLVAAIAVARAVAPRWAPDLGGLLPALDPRVVNGLVWVIVLSLGLLGVALVGRLGKASLEAAQLGLVDRLGGAVAGFLSGALVHAALVLMLCQLGSPEWSQSSVHGTHSQQLIVTLGRRVPLFLDAQAAERLNAWMPEVEAR